MWGISHSQHLHYSIPMALDPIDLQNAFRTCIFIHILGYVPDGANPSSLILLCTLLSLFVGRFCFYSSRSPTISLFIMFYVIVACVYRAITNRSPYSTMSSRACCLPFTVPQLSFLIPSILLPAEPHFPLIFRHGPQHPRLRHLQR